MNWTILRPNRLPQWLACAALPLLLVTSAAAADLMQSALVSVSQPVAQRSAMLTTPETVVFSGQVLLKSRLAKDPDFGEPRLLIDVDLSRIKGVGQTSGAAYMTTGSAQLVRDLVRGQTIEVTFPFARTADMTLSGTRSGRAQLTLDVDVNTGTVMSGLVSMLDR